LDRQLVQVTHRRKNLPDIAEAASAEKDLRAKQDVVVKQRMLIADVDASIARVEKDVEGVNQRVARDKKLLNSGVTGKQATEIDHELSTLARRKSVLEDEELALMQQREELVAQSESAAKVAEESKSGHVKVASKRDRELAALADEEAKLTTDRERLVVVFPAELLGTYDRVRASHGTGAGVLSGTKCGACRLEMTRTEASALQNKISSAVVTCPECGAILIRKFNS
jgi:predicted  nucleic acid-binding Zn-ribbon protein